MNYKSSNGDWYDHRIPGFQTRILIRSIVDSLNRGSLDWNDERAWELLEMGYREIKEGV